MERNLNRMGISTVGQLAKFPLELLEKKFGIIGNQLFYHAHGIDLSEIGAPSMQGQISYGKSQILLLDYTKKEDIKAVLLEICEEVARRTRTHNKVGRTISLGIGYSKDEFGGGFHRTKTIDLLINITMDIYRYCLMLFDKFYTGKTVRSISVTLSNIEEDVNQQLSLFEKDNEKKRKLGFVMDEVRNKYGSKALLAGISHNKKRLYIIAFCYHLVKKLIHINLKSIGWCLQFALQFHYRECQQLLITIIRAWLY
ncbi:DNA polymerase thumb domain-containing protein [Bacillus atrophaeus]|uniref:DinB/UmuC family translesion DNA polymerase n=1 Tax=Bacillus atrophaeus TaxID=1452 RepID=UPI0030C6BD5E